MGVRTANHQLVAGKQYFENDVQYGATVQGAKREVYTAVADETIPANKSGAIIVLGANIDVKLPTPEVGLNYKFVLNASAGGSESHVTATTNGTTAEELFFGCIDINNVLTTVTNKDVIEFQTASAEGDWIEVICVSTSTDNNAQTWFVMGSGAASAAIVAS